MKKLLSLPPNLVECFYEIEQADPGEWFCMSDPIGGRLGSGGGTTWLLEKCWQDSEPEHDFLKWLGTDKRILLHAGGQSRRLPGYAPSGKILTPIPVFRWARGQRLNQNLLSLQLPLYEQIMEKAPASFHTLIASGDVYIRATETLQEIPQADVVCYGLWVDSSLAKNHGVFLSSRTHPDKLDFMLQKPTVQELGKWMQSHYFLMDIGIWLLSDRAVQLLTRRSKEKDKLKFYDLYSDFGLALGTNPRIQDEELNTLKVAVLPLPGGEFYHYGTSRELISSTVSIQNSVNDQRAIMHRKIKPHAAIFVQNSQVDIPLSADNSEVWIENSCVGKRWKLSDRNIVTGVPVNDWMLTLPPGICIDVVPLGENSYVARPYGFNDTFKGMPDNVNTLFMGASIRKWFDCREINLPVAEQQSDLQQTRVFPVCSSAADLEKVIRWMISEPGLEDGKRIWMNSRRLSADDISAYANLKRLYQQREQYRAQNWTALAGNYQNSVFYQLDLKDAAEDFARNKLRIPPVLPTSTPLMLRIHNHMFRSQLQRLTGDSYKEEEGQAFGLLCQGLISSVTGKKQRPVLDVYSDQIVWGRSPVRIDLAGGWTDTPPFCLNTGGNVVNMAIELNGQPPLQVYIKPCKEYKIVLRSIDLGAVEEVKTYEELKMFTKVGSPFSIPKAALVLAGFSAGFSEERFSTLEEQLRALGAGMEITLLAAIPAGSGLGTSSILASTVLGTISDFCGLAWDNNEICQRTLVLEQLLTTGGGWQDQYGGVLQGVKLLQTGAGFNQSPLVKWLPDFLFTTPGYRECHLLYYTGITRTAKDILAEIVRGMFLNSTVHLSLLERMKSHAFDLFEAIQRGNFEETGRLVGKSWQQNKQLDPGTGPGEVEAIINLVKDYCLGYKLPGAGGGGYLYMIAKDPRAAVKIKTILTGNPRNSCARFVDMTLSGSGLQISRS